MPYFNTMVKCSILYISNIKKLALRDKLLHVLYERYLFVGRNLCSKVFGDMLFNNNGYFYFFYFFF